MTNQEIIMTSMNDILSELKLAVFYEMAPHSKALESYTSGYLKWLSKQYKPMVQAFTEMLSEKCLKKIQDRNEEILKEESKDGETEESDKDRDGGQV